MKTGFIFLMVILCFGFGSTAAAQVQCSLTATAPQFPVKAGGSVAATLTAHIDPDWHIYPLRGGGGVGQPSKIEIAEGMPFKISGEVTVVKMEDGKPTTVSATANAYYDEIILNFPLVATRTIEKGAKVAIQFTYQACSDMSCVMPKTVTIEATIAVNAKTR